MAYARRGIILLFIVIMTFTLAACSNGSGNKKEDGKLSVVTSFYPLYEFTKKIGGEHVQVANLVPVGVDAHDWAPNSQDMSRISQADLFIYLGAGLEGWVDATISSLGKKGNEIIEVSNGLKLMSATGHDDHDHDHDHEATEEGHDHDHEATEEGHDHDHDAAHGGHDHDHGEFDPHIWLSPVLAQDMVAKIRDGLIVLDKANQASYEANAQLLLDELVKLDEEFKQGLAGLPNREIVTTHQSFGYLSAQYDLIPMSIMGLSPDAEPTAKDMKEIKAFIEEHNVKYIFFEELVSDKLAKSMANDAKVETLVLHSIEGLTEEQQAAGEDYFSMMRSNLQNLVKALQ